MRPPEFRELYIADNVSGVSEAGLYPNLETDLLIRECHDVMITRRGASLKNPCARQTFACVQAMLLRAKSVSDRLIKVDDIFKDSPAVATTPLIDRQTVLLPRDKHKMMRDKRCALVDLPGIISARYRAQQAHAPSRYKFRTYSQGVFGNFRRDLLGACYQILELAMPKLAMPKLATKFN